MGDVNRSQDQLILETDNGSENPEINHDEIAQTAHETVLVEPLINELSANKEKTNGSSKSSQEETVEKNDPTSNRVTRSKKTTAKHNE